MTAQIYTVPAGAPFLPSLARAILAGDLAQPGGRRPDPLSLPEITLFLPTRRAARAMQDAFLSVSKARALLMPSIKPISEGEEDLTLLNALAGVGATGEAGLDMPPAMTSLRRTLILMQLIHRWRQAMADGDPLQHPASSNTPAQAANLAAELAKLMDDVERENVALGNLGSLVPETYAAHWQRTVKFLEIVTSYWPSQLEADGMMSAAARTNTLILREADRIAADTSNAPLIVAGITGSIPATVELMRAVSRRDGGAIVLPALDTWLDDESWSNIVPTTKNDRGHPEHPQFGFKKLLDALGVDRREVRTLPGVDLAKPRADRAAFISEAMRPSASTTRWHHYAKEADARLIRAALSGVSRIDAPSAQDEAEVVALILREAVETPGRTAALVSPDRVLARRVAIRLEAWGIRVDDSAGRPFAKTVPGTFLNLVVNAARSDFAAADTMALLKHPLCRVGLKAFDIRRYGRALELMAFRAPYLGRGLDGIAAALERFEEDRLAKARQHMAAARLWDEDRKGARVLVDRLAVAFESLHALMQSSDLHPVQAFAKAHLAAAEYLTALPADETTEKAGHPLWRAAAGETAHTFFTELLHAESPAVTIAASDYADLYAALVARENVRERSPVHPRVSIWGPMEARLQQPDVLVLGSLNEGTWPEAAEPGAWLNRPMRQTIGLPAPEEDVGRAALDFTSLLGADRVYLTRAEKIKGVPTVPSRWLMRIAALLKGMKLDDALSPPDPWLAWARARDAIDETQRQRISAPEPRPPVELRPRRLSVTRIETWITNPYAIFASHVLRLEPLPILGASPDQALRGALVHEVVSRFATAHPNRLPTDINGELTAIATTVLERYAGHPRVAAFWLPRLARFLTWFADTEPARRTGAQAVIAETSGSLVLIAPGGPFTLTARADRIDDMGPSLIITDYKTGAIPTDRYVKSGRSPQLPLEAAIAISGSGFPELAGRSVSGLRYIRASGGEPPGEERAVRADDIAALASAASDGLARLVAVFDDAHTPYRAMRRPTYSYDYDAFAHLARVAEWSAHVDDEVMV